jgi:hypothetical protein
MESALIISVSSLKAREIETSVFPTQVGPRRIITGFIAVIDFSMN